jgi:hypothetical protein
MPVYDPHKNQPEQPQPQGPVIHDPFSANYTLPPPKPQHQALDYAKLLGVGAGQLVQGVGYLADKATGGASNQFFEKNTGRSLTDIGGDVADYYRAQLSPAMQESMNKRFISEKPGRYLERRLAILMLLQALLPSHYL